VSSLFGCGFGLVGGSGFIPKETKFHLTKSYEVPHLLNYKPKNYLKQAI
jgi:hypothetical protein